jgi:hypothetical protein
MKIIPLNTNSKVGFRLTRLHWFVASLFVASSFSLQAAEIEKEFGLTTGVSHMSNPNFDTSDRRSVTVFSVSPEFNLNVATELNRFYLKSMLSIYRNSNEEAYADRENPSLTAGWEKTLASGLFGIEAYYNEDTALTNQLNTLGTSAGNDVKNEIKTKSVTAKWDHDFNSRYSIRNQATHADYDYSEATANLFDYQTSEISSRVIYHNSEVLSTYAQVGFLYYNPENTTENGKISRLRFGAEANIFEGMDVDANAGYYRATGLDSSDGIEAQLTGTYTKERMVYNFGASRLITATGISQFQKTSTFVLGAKYLLSELRTVGAEYTNAFNKAPDTVNNRQQAISAFYDHGFKDWTLRASARLMELDNGVARSGNEIGVSLIYGPLRF